MFRVAVVEDDRPTNEQIQGYIRQYAEENQLKVEICAFADGKGILDGYEPVYDIIFLDIEMPQVDGMQAARCIRQQDDDVVLVFITNMGQYAIQGYEVRALDFVLKPISYYAFSVKMHRAIEMSLRRLSHQLMLNTSDGMIRVDSSEIYYVEIQHGVLHYHTEHGEYLVRGTLQNAKEALERDHFVQGNYYYLVNLRHVMRVGKDTIQVQGQELPLSRRNRNAFLDALSDYMGSGI